ncbi:MAG: cation transporter [Rickettsiales bacterium]|jgi:Co/Zn/Cd efflux system component|nr:cation transporter [Rickettsiales bacterium]
MCDRCKDLDFEKIQYRSLKIALLVNLFCFFLECITGVLFNSVGLIADGLDMFADVCVYTAGILAIKKSTAYKKKVAMFNGIIHSILAIFAFCEVIRRFIYTPPLPNFVLMAVVSFIALLGNYISLKALLKANNGEAHIKSVIICSTNDIKVNIGVIIASVFVNYFNSYVPDLIIGIMILYIGSKGIVEIFKTAKD